LFSFWLWKAWCSAILRSFPLLTMSVLTTFSCRVCTERGKVTNVVEAKDLHMLSNIPFEYN
jgi:hypothetical protein